YPECFVFVVRVGVFRGCGGAGRGLRAGADLLRGRRDPDLGGGCGTGGEQSEEQGERLHGASLVGCFPERRGFLVPAGQLRGLAAYCTSGVLLHAQSRAILGWAGTGEHVCLQGGTSAAAQSTAGVSRLNRDLRRFRRTSGGGAVLASWNRRGSRAHSLRQLDDTKRDRAVRRPALSLAGQLVSGARAAASRGDPLGGGARCALLAARAHQPADLDGMADGASGGLRRRGGALADVVDLARGLDGGRARGGQALPLLPGGRERD